MNKIISIISIFIFPTMLLCKSVINVNKEIVVDKDVVEFEYIYPGEKFILYKILDKENRKVELKSNSEKIIDVNTYQSLLLDNLSERKRKFGNLSHNLIKKITRNNIDSLTIWVKLKKEEFYESAKIGDEVVYERQNLYLEPLISKEEIKNKYNLIEYTPKKTYMTNQVDNFVVEVEKSTLQQMMFDENIQIIEYFSDEATELLSSVSTEWAKENAANPSPFPYYAQGNGIKAATLEFGIRSILFSCIGYLNQNQILINNQPEIHSSFTFRLFQLVAPNANHFHHNLLTLVDLSSLNWIKANGIQSISQSTNFTPATDEHHSVTLQLDEMAYSWPYPIFNNPAGNKGIDYPVSWRMYNGISVGSAQRTLSGTFVVANHTSGKNPIYGREMPHVVTIGKPPDDYSWWDYCLGYTTVNYGGTSMAAPVANGIATNIMSSDYRMEYWPEKVRLAMMLTAQNVHSGHWDYLVDGWDGTGVISGTDAVAFSKNHIFVYPNNNNPVENGLYAGAWYKWDNSPKYFKIKAPNNIPSGKHLRVVLLWDSRPDLSEQYNFLSDLDLYVYGNGQAGYGYSRSSPIEVVDIENVVPGGTYDVQVNPLLLNFPQDPQKNYFYWTVGWTLVKTHAD